MIELPDKKKCYNLPEQVAQNLRNITFLAEQYKNIDALPAIWQTYKEEFDNELETFGEWTNTFAGWTEDLNTYLANMSSAAVGAIAGQTIAPAVVNATSSISAPSISGNMITGDSIVQNMTGYSATLNPDNITDHTITNIYSSCVTNGNKVTFVAFVKVNRHTGASNSRISLVRFSLPPSVSNKLYPYSISGYTNMLAMQNVECVAGIGNIITATQFTTKTSTNVIDLQIVASGLTAETDYLIRIEQTFLLSDGLI